MSLMMAMLMLTSLLASVSVFELEDEWNEEAGGRAGYEVELVGTMEPRPSTTDISGGIRNAVDVGDTINFLLVVLNSGTMNITELYISVDVSITGTSTTVAGTGGTPDGAVCDYAPTCAFANFTAGDYLAYGSYAVRDSSGSSLVWTPSVVGEYTVTISLDPGDQDSDLTNNDLVFKVIVRDWYDISLDLTWDDGDPDDTGVVTGTDSHGFTLSAVVDGSAEWQPRNVTLEITFGGSFTLGQSSFDGIDAASQCSGTGDCTFTARMGTPTSVEVYHNLSSQANPPPTPTMADRDVPAFQVAEPFYGTIKADAQDCSGACALYVNAKLLNYLSYELVSTDYGGPGGDHGNESVVNEMMEVDNWLDDRNANNEDILENHFGVYHDVSVTEVTVGSAHSPGGRLDAGNSALYATIKHTGSENDVSYDWVVEFDIRNQGTNVVTTTPPVPDCQVEGSEQQHALLGFLGTNTLPVLTVCTPLILDPGMYSITARITLIDATLTNIDPNTGNATPDDDCGEPNNITDCHVDMNSANDDRTSHYEVVNNGPFVTLTMEVGDGPVMENSEIDFSARALHTGQPDTPEVDGSPDPMLFVWSVNTAVADPQFAGCDGYGRIDCSGIVVDNFWQGTPTVSVTVTDHWGATSTDSVTLKVWNSAQGSLDGAVTVAYDIVYYGSLPQFANFSHADPVEADLTGQGSSYTSAAAFSVDVSAVLPPSDVYSEDMDVSFAGAFDSQYSLWYQGTTGWVSMPSTQSQVNQDTMMLSWSNDGQGSRTSTTYAVFAGANVGDPPQTGITGLSHTLAPGGVISISWSVSDVASIGIDDFGVIIIDGVRNTFALGTTTWEIYGTHDTTYNYTVQVENGQTDPSGARLVGSPVASDSATADGQVDPAVGASDLTAAEEAGNTVAFTWNVADDSDVDHWVVCWSIGDHDADEVQGLMDGGGNSCSPSGDKTASHVSWRPAAAGTYHYSVTAVDSVGNMETAASSTALTVVGDEVIDWTLPPDIGTEADEPPIPQSAWIAIGILVLVAVIAGAFILTRGGGEGGDEEWDY
jgi:hypothetical protein